MNALNSSRGEQASRSRCNASGLRAIFALAFVLMGFVLGPTVAAQTPPAVVFPTTPAAAPANPAASPATTPGATSTTNKDPLRLSIGLEGTNQQGQVSVAVQIVLVMTLLSVAPSIVLLMTTFTRLVIVLGFVRTALGTPSAPSNQIVIGLALFLTFFLMGPVFDRVNQEALRPYLDGQITATQALDHATVPLKEFMLKQTRTRDIEYFLQLGGFGPTAVKDLPIRVVIPAFVISELQTAFQMGFLLFLPFLVIDFLVASVLMAMGMMMMPPVTVALPLKLLLFVLVDGWHLVVRSLVQSFVT
ncbi:flagellar type III secretion system pore protein FliP [Opitutus terrae]|uniref:Flagellar biosynthetic protein FliP n=1 Tax=Opitutus terrae (strain DSM 11246 / JCM 15787 / PB90-1) TaxID=452637 RepID=B1ZR32_OPITP|nr:flagellar type III secretion system pore protein FliP [Opitutus terrae]ACB73699.1 flagellar biosynthetic protein FliP [Opitutus terrae PB90-1]